MIKTTYVTTVTGVSNKSEDQPFGYKKYLKDKDEALLQARIISENYSKRIRVYEKKN